MINNGFLKITLTLIALITTPLEAHASWARASAGSNNGWDKVDCEPGLGWRKCSPTPPTPPVNCHYDLAVNTVWMTIESNTGWFIAAMINGVTKASQSANGPYGSMPIVTSLTGGGVTYTRGAFQSNQNSIRAYEICY